MLAAMSTPSHPRRATCATCLRPQSTCICAWVAPLDTRAEVLILQHPLEVSSAKGSARLLHLSLPGSAMLTGEVFDPRQLSGLLHDGGRMPLLLYPDAVERADAIVPPPPPLDPAILMAPSALRLVVLDGTWRKSRKMLYLNPLLHSLPRLALQDMPPSRYRIRKAHAADQLSTLEAACYALMRIEGGQKKIQRLLDAFDGFVAAQAARTPLTR
jgi:DTW domain-containing protein YfiP